MIQGNSYTLHIGNNLDILPTLPDNSVDSIVTDPPYELGFMGKKWDNSGIAYSVELWTQCLRVLKPGGHLLSFGGTRTWHRVAVAIEDAGFEVRDSIAWMYGSGFPKSLDVSKAIDKAAGAEREVLTETVEDLFGEREQTKTKSAGIGTGDSYGKIVGERQKAATNSVDITAPATPEAQQWEGWGTALKPAFEPIVVARKPLIGTVAENVLTHGTGGLNIDGSRISTTDRFGGGAKGSSGFAANYDSEGWTPGSDLGRWPANVILDEYTAELLDEQSGHSVSKPFQGDGKKHFSRSMSGGAKAFSGSTHNDSGGASRFFYVAKASKRDRNEGLEDIEGKEIGGKGNGLARTCAVCGASIMNPCECPDRTFVNPTRQNFHPTVKPTDLMRYLIKLVTPPGGVVLDPFTGSGSTGKAAILEGFRFIGCELTEDYIPIIEGRLQHAETMAAEAEAKKDEALF
jgi:site-specific DNA-methyltransferase (adenine-specific)